MDYYLDEVLDFNDYIFRGQASENWKLEPTLIREAKKKGIEVDKFLGNHLSNFKLAIRGRRGTNPPKIENDNELWALGQHHGLVTPLLDWTFSPFVAAYFAFIEKDNDINEEDRTNNRVIYALQMRTIDKFVKQLEMCYGNDKKQKLIEIVQPETDENPNLINQNGLLLRVSVNMDIEQWIREYFINLELWTRDKIILAKILIPNSEREIALKSLNRMNINHLTLFPDLHGAAIHCNNQLMIDYY